MLLRRKVSPKDERLDRVREELLLAVRVDEDEIAATASSPDLYCRLRVRIAERRPTRRRALVSWPNFAGGLVNGQRIAILAGAAVILLLLGVAASLRYFKPSSVPEIAKPVPATVPSPPRETEPQPEQTAALAGVPPEHEQSRRMSHQRRHFDGRSTEVATDFLPLTYVDPASQQSGQIVRVKMARSTLIAFGVPMNMERSGELIMADVLVGDDGLPRAIRFVQ